MTCVVGLVYQNRTWIGADSAGVTSRLAISKRKDEKIFFKEGFLFGFSGSFRIGQVLRWQLKVPPVEKKESFESYMNTKMVESIRSCLKEAGAADKHNDTEGHNSSILIGCENRLFCIEGDYQVGELHDPYNAIGCGSDLALGSMYSTAKISDSPEARIKLALEAAERFSAGVRRPFVIRHT